MKPVCVSQVSMPKNPIPTAPVDSLSAVTNGRAASLYTDASLADVAVIIITAVADCYLLNTWRAMST